MDEVNLDEGMRWIEIAPTPNSQTSIILHDKEFVERMSAGVNLGTPSLMFFTENLDQLYADLAGKHVTVGEIHDLEQVREHFYNQKDGATRCIVEYGGHPIGYIQFYELEEEERTEYGYGDTDEIIYGTDLAAIPSERDMATITHLVRTSDEQEEMTLL